jgi:NitT/TauT family transport system substrate-binding protein
MKRREFLALAGASAALGCIHCNPRSELDTIRVCALPYFSMSGLYLAKELGYFEDLGLQIEIEKTANSSQAVPLAAAGKVDVLFSGASPSLINAIARGSRLRIVAGREITAPDCCDLNVLYGRREVFPEGIDNIDFLKGRRVGANLRMTMTDFGTDMILKEAGTSVEKLGILNMSRSELIIAFVAGKLDAIFISDLGRRFDAMSDRIVRGLSLADVLPNHILSFISFGARLLDGDPDVGTGFLTAYLRGARDFVGGKTPRFHDELAVSNGMDPAEARKVCRNNLVADGRIDLPSLDLFIEWAAAKGLCPLPIKAEQLVAMQFLEGQIKFGATAKMNRTLQLRGAASS